MKIRNLVIGLALISVGCAQTKAPPTLTELEKAKLQLYQAQLAQLQAQANPVIKNINDLQETIKKEYPGFQLDLNTLNLVPIPDSTPTKK
jgi:hypothetical protein